MIHKITYVIIVACTVFGCNETQVTSATPSGLPAISHHKRTVTLLVGESKQLHESPIMITAKQTDVKNKTCELVIVDIDKNVLREGFTHEGEYVSFAPELVGRRGLRVDAVHRDRVDLEIRFANVQ